MNKKLIALAVAGACVAPAVMAQTANPVTLYGRIHATFESVEADGAGAVAVPRRNRVSDQASMFGIRGTEDLGGGLKAFFQLETAFKPDQNDTAFAGRNSGVGLQGGWGSLMLGRWDTPWKIAENTVDPYGDITLGGISAALNGTGAVGGTVVQVAASGVLDRRDQNVVQYWSPSWGGFALRASYSANEGKTCTATSCVNPSRTSASASYTGGPVFVAFAWDESTDSTYGSVLMRKMTGQEVVGTVTFGPIKLGGAVQDFKKDPTAGVGWNKQKMWAANITYTIGNNQLIYQHENAKDGGISSAAQPKCDVDAVGYQYNFSRRTFFLAQYTKIDNNATSACAFGSNPLAAAVGQDARGVSLGLRHLF